MKNNAVRARNIERNHAKQALAESEARYRTQFDLASEGIITLALDGKLVEVNEAFARMHGFTKAELLHISLNDLLPSPTPQMPTERMHRILDGAALTFEVEHRHKDGHLFPIEVSASRISVHGKPFILAFHRDITERKRAETYREMGREILQILNEPGDLQTAIQRVITTLKTGTGFDAVGLRLQEGEDFPYFAQEGFSDAFMHCENTLADRTPGTGKVRLECTCGLVVSGKTDPANPLFTPGGSAWTNDASTLLDLPCSQDPRYHPRNQCFHHGYASLALVPVFNQESIVGLLQFNDRRKGCFSLRTVELLEGIALHIGAALMRKLAEERLRESEARYKLRANFVPEAILVYDADARQVVDANPNAERLLGCPREELIGRKLRELFAEEQPQYPAHLQDLEHQLNLALAGQEASLERILRSPRGEVRHCEVRLTNLPSKDRRLLRGSFVDITERRQQEMFLGEMKSLAAKGNVAAYIAHEINNPLAGIRNSFRLVARAIPKDHPHYPFTETITRELDRIGTIIRTVYSLYRPNPAPTRNVVLDETLNDLIQLLSSLATARDVTLELRPSWPVIRGLIPEDLLRQALFNLIQNAIDATPPGGRVVCGGRIAGSELVVEVADTGPGVSEELAGKIFEPGFSTKKAIELSGLGLGLDTCRRLMDAVGGSIRFENLNPGPGALFSLHFPWIKE